MPNSYFSNLLTNFQRLTIQAGAEGVAEPEGEEEDLDEMQSRLEALRS